MPMVTYHPKFGAMFPDRSRNIAGFGEGDEVITSVNQAVSALRNAVCSREAQGYTVGYSEIVSLGQDIIAKAKAQGMSVTTAGSLLYTFYDMAKQAASGDLCPKATPTATPASTPPAPAPSSDNTIAIVALAVGGGLIGYALLKK